MARVTWSHRGLAPEQEAEKQIEPAFLQLAQRAYETMTSQQRTSLGRTAVRKGEQTSFDRIKLRADRIKLAVERIPGCPKQTWGRQKWLREVMLARENVEVPPSAIAKWFNGMLLPKGERLAAFCRLANVTPEWLREGIDPRLPSVKEGASTGPVARRVMLPVSPVAERVRQAVARLPGYPADPKGQNAWLNKALKRWKGVSLKGHMLSRWMTGTSVPSGERLKEFCMLADVDPQWILHGEGRGPSDPDLMAPVELRLISSANATLLPEDADAENAQEKAIAARFKEAIERIPGCPRRASERPAWVARKMLTDEGVAVRESAVEKWLEGKWAVRRKPLLAFCRLAHVDPTWLITGEKPAAQLNEVPNEEEWHAGAVAALLGYLRLAGMGAISVNEAGHDLEAIVHGQLRRLQLGVIRDGQLLFRGPCSDVALVTAKVDGGTLVFTIHYPHPYHLDLKGPVSVPLDKFPSRVVTDPLDLGVSRFDVMRQMRRPGDP